MPTGLLISETKYRVHASSIIGSSAQKGSLPSPSPRRPIYVPLQDAAAPATSLRATTLGHAIVLVSSILVHQFIAMPVLDARRVESGDDRRMGNERERGERAVIEADKVQNCLRGTTVAASVFNGVRMMGKVKETPLDLASVVGVLLV
jgi:hypothetical protein